MISFTNKTSDNIKDYCQEWLHINGNTFFNGIYNIAYCVLNLFQEIRNRGSGKPKEIRSAPRRNLRWGFSLTATTYDILAEYINIDIWNFINLCQYTFGKNLVYKSIDNTNI